MFFNKLFKRNNPYSPVSDLLLKEYNRHRPLGPQKYICYAPFKSIYFGHHGKAVACCFNRDYVLGVYPKQSIREIWQSEAADKLRDYIKHNDFSLGCLGCKQQLIAANFDAVKAKQYDERVLNRNGYPSVMEFELSNVCNLECEMCSGNFSSLIRAKREKLPPLEMAYDSNFVKQLEEFIPHLEEVKFYGGEPFLIDIYYEIWELIARINPKVRISVQTNATTLNSRIKDILQNTNFHINISFDSLQKETYENIRKNAEFERTMENLKWYREYCRTRNTFFGISVCAMTQNWRELPDFINFCNELDCPVYFHTVSSPIHCSIREMKAEQIKTIADELSKFDFPENTPSQKKNRKHYNNYVNQIKDWYNHAAKIKQAQKSESFSDFTELLIQHIQNDPSITAEQKQTKIEVVRKKLEELSGVLTDEFVKKNISLLNTADHEIFNHTIQTIEQATVEQLLEMTKAATVA